MNIKLNQLFFLAVALPALTVLVSAQGKAKIDPEQRYLLLSTMKTSTMQKELDEAAAQGFRIIASSSSCGQSEMVLFLERVAEPPNTFQYRLLATTKTSTMQKELNGSASEGFRLLPRTTMAKEGMLSNEIVLVLERAPRSVKRYEYKLLATSLTSTLQKEVSAAEGGGFTLIGLVSRGENMVIMEKETAANQ
ncbi:MAG: hypothetical protein ACRD9Y_18490 [Blastocatellia bacterium]